MEAKHDPSGRRSRPDPRLSRCSPRQPYRLSQDRKNPEDQDSALYAMSARPRAIVLQEGDPPLTPPCLQWDFEYVILRFFSPSGESSVLLSNLALQLQQLQNQPQRVTRNDGETPVPPPCFTDALVHLEELSDLFVGTTAAQHPTSTTTSHERLTALFHATARSLAVTHIPMRSSPTRRLSFPNNVAATSL